MVNISVKLIILCLSVLAYSNEAVFLYPPKNPFADKSSDVLQKPKIGKASNLKMIKIESQILEISNSDLSVMGFSFDRDPNEIIFYINYLLSNGSANLLAKPNISALEGEEASIQIGDKIPYSVPVSGMTDKWTIRYLDTGIKLKIKSFVEDKYIVVDVRPEVSNISQWRKSQAGVFPVISTRESHTKVRVKNKDPIIIGGLLSDHKRQIESGVPFLKDTPFLGSLFKSNTTEIVKTDIVFIVIPEILN